MIGKRLINTGVAAADALVPSEHFNTVLYTGNGGTQRIGGYINRGAVFNGSSSKITNTGFSITGNRSVSFWVRMNSSSSQNTGILSTWNDGADYLEGITVRGGASNTNFVLSVDTTNHTIAALNTNWNHIAIIYDGTYYQAYFNGTQVLTNISVQSSIEKLSNLQLGARHTPTDTQYFSGKIDQVRVFDKALSSSEVTTLYGETHASTTISTTDIFSDNSGIALYQLDGNANDTGGVTGRTEGTESAIFSNADNSNFNLGNATVVNNSFGVSFWVKMNKISQSENVYLCSFMYGSNTSLYMDTSNVLQVSNGGYSRNESFSTTHTFAADTWYHIVYTGQIVGDGTLRCYVNGTQVGSRGWITGHNYTLTSGNRIGSYNNGDQSIDGQIADFRIYKSTHLSSSDVTALYSGTPPTTGLTEYYKFDGNDRNYAGDRQLTPSNVIYNYSGTATNVTYQEATKFQPDLVWIKSRSYANNHFLYDSVRGTTKAIYIQAEAEITRSGVTSFDSNGFTLGTSGDMNTSSATYVGWCFKGGGTAVSNTDGTLTSQVSANQDAGFSIGTYSGNSTAGATIGHGLSSAPELLIVKSRNTIGGSSKAWTVYAEPIGNTKYLYLNTTAGEATYNFWNNTTPTSTVFSLSTDTNVNSSSGNYVFYAFHSVDGYSKVGSYTGNNSSNIVQTGFEPAFVMVKLTSAIDGQWVMYDNERSPLNPRTKKLAANSSVAENDGGLLGGDSAHQINFLSDGFELLETSGGVNTNKNGETYIYLAIAADPDTTTPTVENSFDIVTYQGNGSTQDINTDFKPDLVWIKARSIVSSHNIFDSIRGNKRIVTNATSAEVDLNPYAPYGLTSFNSNGFTIGDNYNGDYALNGDPSGTYGSSQGYVAYAWKAGDHDDNLPQINTEGSIDSVVSVNAEAGFSIVKYSSSGSVGATVGHGLSSTPELYIIKETSAADDWMVVAKIGSSYQRGKLQTTDAFSTAMSGVTNNVDPTSTVITLGNSGSINQSGQDYIGYFFHSVSGYQKIGSYTGNGGSQTISVGFQPRFVMIKRATGGNLNGWVLSDSVRSAGINLFANTSGTEVDESAYGPTSFTSDGFTLALGGGNTNAASSTYIYLAIA